jgi:hypothetical protein
MAHSPRAPTHPNGSLPTLAGDGLSEIAHMDQPGSVLGSQNGGPKMKQDVL